LLQLLAYISEILPIIFYLSFIKRNRGEGLWVIFLYCSLSLLYEPAFSLLGKKIPKFYIYTSFTILEFTLFSFFFFSSLKEKKFKYIPVIGAVIFYAIAFSSLVVKHGQDPFDSLSASVEALLIISYCILLLYEQITDPTIIFVYNTKKFWTIIAFFLYFSSTLFLFLYAATFTKQERSNYWSINNFFEMLKNILFSISFILKKSDKQPYPIDNIDNLNPDI
jgi:hypothetical protein